MGLSQTIQDIIAPIAQQNGVPLSLASLIAQYESSGNPSWVGDGPQYGGYSYGLYQLHVGTGGVDSYGDTGQGNSALQAITGHGPPYSQSELNTLLDPNTNATYGMPPIAKAWKQFGPSFDDSLNWWIQFCAASGHPGGGAYDPITVSYAKNVKSLYDSGGFGTIVAGSGGNPVDVSTLSATSGSLLSGLPAFMDTVGLDILFTLIAVVLIVAGISLLK